MSTSCTLPGGWFDPGGTCRREVVVGPLRGADEEWLYGLPPRTPEIDVVIGLLARCIERIGPHAASPAVIRELLPADAAYLALQLHRSMFGDAIELVLVCPSPTCGERMDAMFDIGALPVEARPQVARHALSLDELGAPEVEFRLPRVGDVEAIAHARPADPVAALLARCVVAIAGRPLDPSADTDVIAALPEAARAALDAEMERLAPRVEDAIAASCPECGQTFSTSFDPIRMLLARLARQRREFNRGVHLLSFHYHWPLTEILGMSRPRRQHYVRLLLDELEAGSGLTTGLR